MANFSKKATEFVKSYKFLKKAKKLQQWQPFLRRSSKPVT